MIFGIVNTSQKCHSLTKVEVCIKKLFGGFFANKKNGDGRFEPKEPFEFIVAIHVFVYGLAL